MTERRRAAGGSRRVLVLAAVLVTTLSLFAVATPVAAADVSADCAGDPSSAGNDGGAAFVADSNFTVYYNDSEPMPDSGVFLNDSAMEFRNVTLVANGTADLRLESGTGETTCYGDVDATGTPVAIAPADGGASVVVDGAVDSLSVGPTTVDSGSVTLAYDAPSEWNVTVGVDESSGTDLEAEDADSGSTLDDGTVDDGTLVLSLPAGSHAVALAGPPSGGGGGGGGSGPADETDTPTLTEVGGGGDPGDDDTETATATPGSTATESPTASPTETAESSPEPTDDSGGATPPDEDGGSPLPLFAGVLLIALLAVGAGAWFLSDT